MKKRLTSKINVFVGIVVLTILLSAMNGCSTKKETVKIGVVGTMSGMQSDLSVSGRRGIEIAVDEINERGGINGCQIELIIKNDENNYERAAEIVQEFADEGVSYVIGHYTSGMMLAAYDELSKHDILYLGPTISSDSLSLMDDNFIRFIASTKEQAEILNTIALRDDHVKFVILFDEKNLGFNELLYHNFEEILMSHGGEVVWNYGFETIDETVTEEMVNYLKLIESETLIFFAGIFISET